MKLTLSAFLALLLTSAVFGATGWARVGPLTWNSFVAESGFYTVAFSDVVSDVVSRFTPAQAIVVTRMEVQAAQGSQRTGIGLSKPCTKPVSFKVTDGEQSFTLPLPSAAPFVLNTNNPSSFDSGPLDLAFPAGAKIVLSVIPGDPPDPNGHITECFINVVNITVQYEVNSPEHRSEERSKQKEEQK